MEGLSDWAGISRSSSARGRVLRRRIEPIDAHRTRDILQALLAGIDKVGRHLALHLSPDVLGNRDAAGLGDALDPRRDVDAIAKDIFAVDDDVADIDPNPELDWIGLGATSIVLPKLPLNLIAHVTASTALANSTSAPSPISLTMRPEWAVMAGSISSRLNAFSRDSVPASSTPMRRE